MKNTKKLTSIAIVGAVIFGVAVMGYYLYQNSGDRGRFTSIKRDCINAYNKDTANGNRYLVYPCSDRILRSEFSSKYGYEYPY